MKQKMVAGLLALGVLAAAGGAKAQAVLYQHCGYGGYAVPVGEGYQALSALQRKGMKNDDVSSVRGRARL